MVDDKSLNQVQYAAYTLIQSDLKFLYTVICHIDPQKSNYIPSLLPFIGIIIDGAEDWIKAVNNSSKNKLQIPQFTHEEERFYEQIRNSIKLWQRDYETAYSLMQNAYVESNQYFGSVCRPIAKTLHLYDIYGVDTVNGAICGNTILCRYYSPFFKYDGNNGEYIKKMAEIGGRYIVLFDAIHSYSIDNTLIFDVRDYGGFEKSPVGNKYSDGFILFSILCQINFIIYCVGHWIKDEIPIKLRFAYLLYYSLLDFIPDINKKIRTNFILNAQWKNDKFRNAMAHYKLGIVMREKDLQYGDPMLGLTDHILNERYHVVKDAIYCDLESLAVQIGDYLKLKSSLISPNT